MSAGRRLAWAAVPAVLAIGCAGTAGLTPLRSGLRQDLDTVRLERVTEIGVGPFAMFWLRSFLPEEGGAATQALWAISRAEVGVYEVHSSLDPEDLDAPLRRIAIREGWTPLLRVRENDELTWALSPEGKELKELFMVVLEDEELVLLKLCGDISTIVRSLGVWR